MKFYICILSKAAIHYNDEPLIFIKIEFMLAPFIACFYSVMIAIQCTLWDHLTHMDLIVISNITAHSWQIGELLFSQAGMIPHLFITLWTKDKNGYNKKVFLYRVASTTRLSWPHTKKTTVAGSERNVLKRSVLFHHITWDLYRALWTLLALFEPRVLIKNILRSL